MAFKFAADSSWSSRVDCVVSGSVNLGVPADYSEFDAVFLEHKTSNFEPRVISTNTPN